MGKRLRDGKKAGQEAESRKRERTPSESSDEGVEMLEMDQLPLPEMLRLKVNDETGDRRVVLEALHTLNEQVQKIEDERSLEIQKIMMQYFKKMKPLLRQAEDVIQGQGKGSDLIKNATELSKEQITKGVDGLGLEDYWPNVFKGSELRDAASVDDKRILDSVVNFSMDADKNEHLSKLFLEFTFKNCPLLKANKWKCTLSKDQQGHVKAETPEPLKYTEKCELQLFDWLSGKGDNVEGIYDLFNDFFEEVYPRSLYYYFNLAPAEHRFDNEEDDESEFDLNNAEQAEQDDEEEEESEQEQDKPQKKRKQEPTKQAKPSKEKPAQKTEKPQCNTQ